MPDGNIFFLLKHLLVTALTAGVFLLFGWWLRGRMSHRNTRSPGIETGRLQRLTTELDTHKQRTATAEEEAGELRSQLAVARALQQQTGDGEADKLRSQLKAAQPLLQQLDAEKQRAKTATEEIAKLNARLAALQPSQQQLDTEKQRSATAAAEIARLNARLATFQSAQQELDAEKQRTKAATDDDAALRSQLATSTGLQQQLAAEKQRASTAADELGKLRAQLDGFQTLQQKLDTEKLRTKDAKDAADKLRAKLKAAQIQPMFDFGSQGAGNAAEDLAKLRGEMQTLRGSTVPSADHLASQNALAAEQRHTADLRAQVRALQDAAATTAVQIQQQQSDSSRFFGKKIAGNDLTVIEGIGPKIAQLLIAADIKTWSALAAASIARIREILHAAGTRFTIHDPTTWPEQSRLAQDGKWEELKRWQDAHVGGLPAE